VVLKGFNLESLSKNKKQIQSPDTKPNN